MGSLLKKINRKKNKNMNVVIKLDGLNYTSDDGETKTAANIIRDTVMTLPYWRLGALATIDAAEEIEDALDKNETSVSISPDARTKLGEAMRMEGLNVTMPHKMLRVFRKINRAVLIADKEQKEEK